MKKLVLMFIPALICGVAFTSCNAEKAEPQLITSDGLYVIGTKSGVVPTSITDLVFTDDDIVSFDVSSVGEMVFTKEKTEEIISRARLHSELHFFIDGKPVFSPPIKIYFGWGSLDDIDLQFRISDYDKIYLTDIYQHLDSLLVIDREILEVEFEANRQKRKQEMDVLIKYLSDAGKIVDRTGGSVLPPEIEEPELPEVPDTLRASVSFAKYSLTGTSCHWKHLTYPYPYRETIVVINSKEDLEKNIECVGESDYPVVDFSTHTLLFAHGIAPSSVVSTNCNSLQQLSEQSYIMTVDIVIGMATVMTNWQVPIIVSKLSEECTIELVVTMGH
jgi:hypothetical protein